MLEEDHARVFVFEGDSALVMASPPFTQELQEPALFWLDAHWSITFGARGEEDTPLYGELRAIMSRNNEGDVILVDDIRTYRGSRAPETMRGASQHSVVAHYPELDEVLQHLCALRPHWIVRLHNDILRVHAPYLLAPAAQVEWLSGPLDFV